MMDNTQQELLVAKYQATEDERYLNDLIEQYRPRIQARAIKESSENSLDDLDCESAMMNMLWHCCQKWDAAKGIPFNKFVSVMLRKAINRLAQDASYKDGHLEKIYMLAKEGFDLVDPSQDIENLVAEQDAARSLLEYIGSRKEVLATVAALRAAGHDFAQIAEFLNYNPEVKHPKDAKRVWVNRRLKDARQPALDYYFKVLKVDKLPINLTV